MLRIKSTIVAAAAAAAFVMAPTEGKADVNLHFGLNAPGFGIYTDRGHRYRNRGYDRRHRYNNSRMSCREARRLVRSHGFRRIRPLDCNGRVYTFRARRHGDVYRIRVNARRHSISRVRRVS